MYFWVALENQHLNYSSVSFLVNAYCLCIVLSKFFIKNVCSSTTHKKTPSFRLYVFTSFREFKKILRNTFIY